MHFKEHYWHIPPHMYNDVRAHIQEMLDISAIHKLHSLWASRVVLVQKKDGDLRFCIDLRKPNNWTVKDAYLLPEIDKTLLDKHMTTGRINQIARGFHAMVLLT